MKKTTLLLIMMLMLSSFLAASDDYEWNGNGAQYSFLAKFDFNDLNNCYSNIGFSQTPIIGDNTTPYDNSLLIMKSDGLTDAEDALVYSASTFLYWHIAQGCGQKLVLEIMPTAKAQELTFSYTPFEDSKAVEKVSKTTDGNEKQVVDIASFTNYGRFSNSSPFNITIITKGSEERGVVAKLTLRLESI